jgi:uncharacterized protein involved in exopolysaccharide biosynthesis
MTVSNNNPDEQVFTLRDLTMNYLALARRGVRYWFRGAVIFTVVFLAGLAWVVTKPRVYKSEAAFQVQDSNTSSENNDASEEHIQRSVEARLNQIYGSRRYMMNIIRELHLYDHLLGVGPDGRPFTSESKIVDIFSGGIDRRVERNIVHLGFTFKDPARAQQVVQALIRLFVNERKMAAEEQAREPDAHLPASREGGTFAVKLLWLEAQALQYFNKAARKGDPNAIKHRDIIEARMAARQPHTP